MPKTNKLSKEQIANIRGYKDKIKSFEVFADAVRQNPGQFIGYIGTKGHINMFREVFQNAIDEILRKYSPCNYIRVEYYENTHTIIVTDNGRGIPFGRIIDAVAKQNTSTNYEKELGDYTSGLHGVGTKVTNALSSEFFVNSYRCKEASESGKAEGRRIEFKEGHVWEHGELEIENPNNIQGTIIEFRPSYQIMGEIDTSCEDILRLVSAIMPLVNIGAVTDFYGIKEDGTVVEEHIVNEDGTVSYLICATDDALVMPIVMHKDNGTIRADISFTYDIADSDPKIMSFANTCPTINDSTHVSGFLDAVSNYFRIYMNKIYLNKSKTEVCNNDIKYGLRAVISAFHIKPYFSGQAKEIFSNKDVIPFIKTLVVETLDEWCKTNNSDLQKMCSYFQQVAVNRMKADKEKVNMVKRYAKSATSGLPAKYERPNGDKNLELILMEGDSAKGPCANARCAERQGLFPLRGKIANAMAKSPKEFWENEEAQAIRDILDSGFGKSFDINKCKFEKIIMLCDADLDGLHIRTLILKMFLMYYSPLVEAGRIYAAEPPLYHAIINKKSTYFTTKLDLIKYTQDKFGRDNKVFDINKKSISNTELNGILYRNSKYIDVLKMVSDDYAIDPHLLEFALAIRNQPFDNFKRQIKEQYRFVDVRQANGVVILDGLVEGATSDKCNTVILHQNLLNACVPLLRFIDNEAMCYSINGENISLYGLMERFLKYQPSNIDRYKGIGQMNATQLRESTLHPDYNRTLIRYTTQDIKREIEEIREIECNKNLLFKDIDIASYEF